MFKNFWNEQSIRANIKLHLFFRRSYLPGRSVLGRGASMLTSSVSFDNSFSTLGNSLISFRCCTKTGAGFFLDSWYWANVPMSSTFFLFDRGLIGLELLLSKCRVLPDFSVEERVGLVIDQEVRMLLHMTYCS